MKQTLITSLSSVLGTIPFEAASASFFAMHYFLLNGDLPTDRNPLKKALSFFTGYFAQFVKSGTPAQQEVSERCLNMVSEMREIISPSSVICETPQG